MFSKNFNDVLSLLLDAGITLEVVKREGKLGVNLNTRAKSELIVCENDNGSATGYGRYNDTWDTDLDQPPEDIVEDLCYIVKECMHGRDHVDGNWLELMVNHSVVQGVTTTTISFK